ncbi:DNA topoisomerase 3 [Spathaspora sp. JA1]|nr:DNA topoisomerase 3 [Spathaspora sp. JA1]
MKILCVAEKPSIAKAVANILGGGNVTVRNSKNKYIKNYDFSFNFSQTGHCDVTMTSVVGHITKLETKPENRWGKCSHGRLFDCDLLELVDKQDVFDNISREASQAQKLMIWTDCDREGEYIGFEIFKAANKGNRRIQIGDIWRGKFSHLERNHIIYAANNPIRLDMKSVAAVGCRMEVDFRVGTSFTRLLTESLRQYKLIESKEVASYGTCQFPTLGFIVDRYKRVKSFVPEDFWFIDLEIVKDGDKVGFNWVKGHYFDRLYVLCLYERCLNHDFATVVKLESKPTSNWRPLPLTTVELQKDCSRYFKMSAKRALDAAERLYNKGFISYPRTETDKFPQTMDFKKMFDKQKEDPRWGDYAQSLTTSGHQSPRNGSHDDEAHPAIHPVNYVNLDALDNQDERKVYEYVVRRFLACCSEDATGVQTVATLKWGDELFTATGLMVLKKNYLDAFIYKKWESSKQLPHFTQGEQITISSGKLTQGKTGPPNHMTESELIALMDVNGIGTDATIAEHIEKILDRGYIAKQKSGKQEYILPSKLGMGLIEGFDKLEFENISLSKPFLRKELEKSLQDIVNGTKLKADVFAQVKDVYKKAFAKTNENIRVITTECQKLMSGDMQQGFGSQGFGKPSGGAFGSQTSNPFAPSSTSTTTTTGFGSTGFGSSGFGGAAQSSTGFGSSGFGNAGINKTTGSSGFGSAGFGGGTTTSAFGSSSFGSSGGAFGTGGGGAFGSSSLSNTSKPSAFSAFASSDNKSSPFGTVGQTGSVFGGAGAAAANPFAPKSTTTSAFGSSTSQPSAFGSTTSQPSAFGSNTTTANPFGQQTAATSAFGSTTKQPVPFGSSTTPAVNPFAPKSTTTSAFGSTTSQPSAFGSTTNQSSPFGTTTTSAFGSKPATTSAFGSTATAPQSNNSSPFATMKPATMKPTTTSAFGGAGNTSSTSSPFGTITQGQSVFGASTLPFGSQQQSASVQDSSNIFGTTKTMPNPFEPNTPATTIPSGEIPIEGLEDLDPSVIEAFRSTNFSLGLIPDAPPPMALCLMICIECGNPDIKCLYSRYKSEYIRLTVCPECDQIADKYIEYDSVILFLDILLLKKQAYRHLSYNLTEIELLKQDKNNKQQHAILRFFHRYKQLMKIMLVFILFEVYCMWATEEKNPDHSELITLILDQPILNQYGYFISQVLLEKFFFNMINVILFRCFCNWGNSNLNKNIPKSLQFGYSNSVMIITILIANAIKLFPILMLIWPYDHTFISRPLFNSICYLYLLEALHVVTSYKYSTIVLMLIIAVVVEVCLSTVVHSMITHNITGVEYRLILQNGVIGSITEVAERMQSYTKDII